MKTIISVLIVSLILFFGSDLVIGVTTSKENCIKLLKTERGCVAFSGVCLVCKLRGF